MATNEKDLKTLSLADINSRVKKELVSEFGVDVGFKYIDEETALSYIAQVAVQRVKQRIRGKEERELFKKLKQELKNKGVKI